jgi:hypothetical protein
LLEIISTLQQAATSAFNKSEREIPLTQQRQSGKDASKITPPTLPAGTRSGLDIGFKGNFLTANRQQYPRF